MKAKLLLIFLACATELLLLRLGFWQLARADEKQAQIEALQAVLREKKPIDLSAASRQSMDYQWVHGDVMFMKGPALLLDNQRRGRQVGVTVYHPALLPGGSSILVELGWLPVTGDRQLPQTPTYDRNYTLQGLLLPPPSAGIALGPAAMKQADGRWLMTRVDLPALESIIGGKLAMRILRPDPALKFGFTRDFDVLPNSLPPEKHRAYAFQWFGLALAFLCLSLYVLKRKK